MRAGPPAFRFHSFSQPLLPPDERPFLGSCVLLLGAVSPESRLYRDGLYWPWLVFMITYTLLSRTGETSARLLAEPLPFGAVIVALMGALALRIRSDLEGRRASAKLPGALLT